jgi:hypothetical protein
MTTIGLLVAAIVSCASAEPDPSIELNRISKLRDEDKCYDNSAKPQVRKRALPTFPGAWTQSSQLL